ncbi:MAG: hypothetical protein JSR21_10275 [Proteobacteria bacterium]|nr:hypothetical protein [Pseudomonadota bacterium]
MPAFNRAASRPGAAKSKEESEGQKAADRATGRRARDQARARKGTGGTAGDAGSADHASLLRRAALERKKRGVCAALRR